MNLRTAFMCFGKVHLRHFCANPNHAFIPKLSQTSEGFSEKERDQIIHSLEPSASQAEKRRCLITAA